MKGATLARVETVHSTRELGRASFGGAVTGNGARDAGIDTRRAFVLVVRALRARDNVVYRTSQIGRAIGTLWAGAGIADLERHSATTTAACLVGSLSVRAKEVVTV